MRFIPSIVMNSHEKSSLYRFYNHLQRYYRLNPKSFHVIKIVYICYSDLHISQFTLKICCVVCMILWHKTSKHFYRCICILKETTEFKFRGNLKKCTWSWKACQPNDIVRYKQYMVSYKVLIYDIFRHVWKNRALKCIKNHSFSGFASLRTM